MKVIIFLIYSRKLIKLTKNDKLINLIWSNCFDWVKCRNLSFSSFAKMINLSLNLIEMIKLSFSRFLNVKCARASLFSFSATDSSFVKINVSSVCKSTTSNNVNSIKLMNSMRLMCNKHKSNVDSIIDNIFL